MDHPETAILTALLTLVLGVIASNTTGVKKWIDAWWERKAKETAARKFVDGIERVAMFHNILENFRACSFVDRVLLFRGSNCGGTPDPKRPYNVRCFYGWSKDPTKHPEDAYNFDMPVDYYYMNMLLDVCTKGQSFQRIDKMPETARLGDYYRQEGVVFAALYYLSLDENEMLYVSVASYKDEFSQSQLISLQLIIDRARACLVNPGSLEHIKLGG